MSKGQTQQIPKSQRGAAMLAALCLAVVFAICLTSYIALSYTALTVSTRNLASSHAIELAEAGVELALYSESNNDWASWYITGTTANAYPDTNHPLVLTSYGGLVPSASSPTPFNLGNGVTGTVLVSITSYLTNPTITATATMNVPHAQAVVRKIVTTAATSPLFVNAVAGTSGKVKFSLAGSIDSYDSRAGAYSAASAGYQAVVLSGDMASTRTVRLGTASLSGYAVGYDSSAPTSTGWFMGTGKVISHSGATGVDATRVISNPNPYQPTYVPPVNPPTGTGNLPPLNCVGASNILSKGPALGSTSSSTPLILYASGINLTSNVVGVQGPVIIILYGNMTISGTGGIQLTTANAALTIFVENGSMSLGGGGITFINTITNPLPKRVSILSTNNNNAFSNTITISTPASAPFVGTIYFPNLPITVSSAATIYGSIVGESVTLSNSPAIHYDVALRSPDTTPGDFAFTLFSAPTLPGTLTESVGP